MKSAPLLTVQVNWKGGRKASPLQDSDLTKTIQLASGTQGALRLTRQRNINASGYVWLYASIHTVKPQNMYRPLIIVILDVPDNSDALGPSPVLHRSFSQQESHITVPSASGDVHLLEQPFAVAQLRLKVVTEPSLRIVLTMVQRSSEVQLTTSLLPGAEVDNLQYLRASGLFSRTQR